MDTFKLKEIYVLVQQTRTYHQKRAIYLKGIYEKNVETNFEQFKLEFLGIHSAFLLNPGSGNEYVKRAFEFTALFLSILQKNNVEVEVNVHPLLNGLVDFLCENGVESLEHNIRMRSIELLSELMKCLVHIDLPVEFCDSLQNTLLGRLNDPRVDIRILAVGAVYKLQDPTDVNDIVTKKFINSIKYCRFVKVRLMCVKKIAVTRLVLEVLIEKLRDGHEDVRLAVYDRLKPLPRVLSIQQRREILHSAMYEYNERNVRFIWQEFLPRWLFEFKDDFHKLMSAVRLDEDEEEILETNKLCEFILNSLLKTKPMKCFVEAVGVSELDKLIPIASLNWETSNFWRILVEHTRCECEFLPELTFFCSYIERFCATFKDTSEFQFVLQQLFKILATYDVSETYGRRAMIRLVRKVPLDVPMTADTFKTLMKCVELFEKNVDKRAQFVNELISELRTSDVVEVQRRGSTDEDEIVQVNDDVSIVARCCNMASGFILASGLKTTTPSMDFMKTSIFGLNASSDLPFEVLYAFGLFCLLDKNEASRGIISLAEPILLYDSGGNCDIRGLLFSMKIVADSIRKFGPKLLGDSLEKILNGFIDLMEDEFLKIREVATRCLCILVNENRTPSEFVITNLVLKYIRPQNDSTGSLIGFTLVQLPHRIPKFHEIWENVIWKTLKFLLKNEEKHYDFCVIKLEELMKFMLKVFQTNMKEQLETLKDFALKITKKIEENPRNSSILTKMLNMLNFPKGYSDVVLVDRCQEIIQLTDRYSARNLTKFISKLAEPSI